MKQNKFDLVMEYIDENIQSDNNTIKSGIINLIGIDSNAFGYYFRVLTGDTLGSYIRGRRLYFAATELQQYPQKPICDIALDYRYSDQSAFTRAFTSHFGFSPTELRQKNTIMIIRNNKYYYTDFDSHVANSRSSKILREFERTGFIFGSNLDFIECAEKGHEEFGFDIDICYAIADIAEKLSVPVSALMQACFDCVNSNSCVLSNDEIAAIKLGIHSYEDLQMICEYYACQYYELNHHMVDEYYRSHS